jgi:hypothetical protein
MKAGMEKVGELLENFQDSKPEILGALVTYRNRLCAKTSEVISEIPIGFRGVNYTVIHNALSEYLEESKHSYAEKSDEEWAELKYEGLHNIYKVLISSILL